MVYYLPNLDRPQDAPTDWDAFWKQADFMVELVRCDLEKDLQTREAAIADEPSDDLPSERYDLIRFRKSDDPDQLAYFYELGRETLDIVEELLPTREWTPVFAHHWSILMFAHGFIMPSAFAVEDDLDNDRRGIRGREATSREPQRRWYAHYLLREFKPGVRRAAADDRILRLVKALVDGATPMPTGFNDRWFKGLLDDLDHELSSTLTLIGRPKAEVLVEQGMDGLPPVDLSIP